MPTGTRGLFINSINQSTFIRNVLNHIQRRLVAPIGIGRNKGKPSADSLFFVSKACILLFFCVFTTEALS